jgi:hypothetical protein
MPRCRLEAEPLLGLPFLLLQAQRGISISWRPGTLHAVQGGRQRSTREALDRSAQRQLQAPGRKAMAARAHRWSPGAGLVRLGPLGVERLEVLLGVGACRGVGPAGTLHGDGGRRSGLRARGCGLSGGWIRKGQGRRALLDLGRRRKAGRCLCSRVHALPTRPEGRCEAVAGHAPLASGRANLRPQPRSRPTLDFWCRLALCRSSAAMQLLRSWWKSAQQAQAGAILARHVAWIRRLVLLP